MNNESKKKESILRNNAVQTIIASLLCIVIGLLIGYLVLLIINPAGAAGAITAIIKNYFYYPSQKAMMKYREAPAPTTYCPAAPMLKSPTL